MSRISTSSSVAQRSAAVSRAGGDHRGSRSARTGLFVSTIDPLRVLRRHAVGIIGSGIIGAALSVAAYLALVKVYPLYSESVYFEIQPGIQDASNVSTIDLTNDDMVYRMSQTETYLLTSRGVLERAINDPDIRKTAWHRKFLSEAGTFNFAEAVDELQDDIRSNVVRNSNLFALGWSTHEAEDVPKVLNAITKSYMDTRRAKDREVYDGNLSLFEGQLGRTQRDLDDLAQQMQRLIREKGITTLEDPFHSAQAFEMQKLTENKNNAAAGYVVARTNYEMLNNKLQGRIEPSAEDYYEAEQDRSVLVHIDAIQNLSAQLRRFQTERQADNAVISQTNNMLQAHIEERDKEIQRVMRLRLEAKVRISASEVERYRSAVEELESELEKNSERLQQLTADQTQYEAMKNRREHLEARREADLDLINQVQMMRLRADAARVKVAQGALTPREKSFPKPEIIVPLGILLITSLTVGIVFLRELMDQRVKSAQDLSLLPGARVLGTIPDLDDEPTKAEKAELVVRSHPMSVLAESYRQCATELLPLLELNGHQTLLLVGGLPGTGTTTVATNLAAAASVTGRSVLLIDANFRRPRLAEVMGVVPETTGFGDLLNNSASLNEVIHDASDGISVIGPGTPANRVFDRLSNGAFEGILAELRGRFDLIIFDSPPGVVAGDAMVLANKVDAALLVVRAHQEHRGLVARMINRLTDARCELVGVLLNRPRGQAGGYLRKNYAAIAQYSASSSH